MAFHITKANTVTFPQIIALRARLGRAQYVLVSFVPCLFIVQTTYTDPKGNAPEISKKRNTDAGNALPLSNQQTHQTKDAMPHLPFPCLTSCR